MVTGTAEVRLRPGGDKNRVWVTVNKQTLLTRGGWVTHGVLKERINRKWTLTAKVLIKDFFLSSSVYALARKHLEHMTVILNNSFWWQYFFTWISCWSMLMFFSVCRMVIVLRYGHDLLFLSAWKHHHRHSRLLILKRCFDPDLLLA